MLFVAIDDHARIAFTAMRPDERRDQAVLFLRNAVRYFASLGVTIKRLLTDNGAACSTLCTVVNVASITGAVFMSSPRRA